MVTDYGVAVQIGLAEDCELKYLASPNWRELLDRLDAWTFEIKSAHHGPYHFAIPRNIRDVFTHDRWIVYGVDSDIISAAHVKELTEDLENVHILERFISSPSNTYVSQILGDAVSGYKCTLDELLGEIETDAGSAVDFLFMDIDGGELNVFEHSDFQNKPTFIHIEAHRLGIATQILPKILENGYILTNFSDTADAGADINMQFVREDEARTVAYHYLNDHGCPAKTNDVFFGIDIGN